MNKSFHKIFVIYAVRHTIEAFIADVQITLEVVWTIGALSRLIQVNIWHVDRTVATSTTHPVSDAQNVVTAVHAAANVSVVFLHAPAVYQ